MIRNLLDVFRYGELIRALVTRDLKVRYKSSVLGYAWTWLDPLMSMFAFIFVFEILLKFQVPNFPVFLLTGLIPWTFFSNSMSASVRAITGNSEIIKKVYYPREIFPLTGMLSDGINMLLSLLVLIPVVIAFGIPLTPKLLLLPVPALFLFFLTYGLSLMISAINVYFRDMTYIVPFVMRLLFFMTPIFYDIQERLPPDKYPTLHGVYMVLNPLGGLFGLFRASLMDLPLPEPVYIATSLGTCVLVFVLGYTIFKRFEDSMVKRI